MKLRKCPRCKTYTLKDVCRCGEKTTSPHPPKFSPEDKWGSYRRKSSMETMKKDD